MEVRHLEHNKPWGADCLPELWRRLQLLSLVMGWGGRRGSKLIFNHVKDSMLVFLFVVMWLLTSPSWMALSRGLTSLGLKNSAQSSGFSRELLTKHLLCCLELKDREVWGNPLSAKSIPYERANLMTIRSEPSACRAAGMPCDIQPEWAAEFTVSISPFHVNFFFS